MRIESTNAQITVNDSVSNAVGNIHNRLSGYACDISFCDGSVYLCRREGDPFLHVVLVPSKKWENDLKDDGFEVLVQLPTLHASLNSIGISYKSANCTVFGKPEYDREHDVHSQDCNHAFTTQPTEPPLNNE